MIKYKCKNIRGRLVLKNILAKIILLILCASMMLALCASLASCDSDDDNDDEFVDDFVEEEDAPELPEKKYNSDFVILGQHTDDYYVKDAKSGDIVEYAMYMRNIAVEEKYGIKIVPTELFYALVPERVSDLIKANDSKSIDLVANQITYSSNIVIAGNAVDWYTVPYINFEDEWWPDFNKDTLTLNGKAFMVTNDFLNTSITHTPCMYFNKELARKYSMGDIYGYVKDGKWTYEKMETLVTGVYEDLNKNGRNDTNDLYGLRIGSFTSNTVFVNGFDNPVLSTNENTGEFEFTYYSNKLTRIARNLKELYRRTEGVRYDDGKDQLSDFAKGNGVFVNGIFESMITELRGMTGWGIVPLPKYNDKQTSYTTVLGGGANAMLVPKIGGGEEKLEKIGVVITDLTYRSYKDVRVKLYDKALKGKYADDVSEAQMVDEIYKVRKVDFGAIYMGFDAPCFHLQSMLSAGDSDVMGAYGRNRPTYERVLGQVYESFGLSFDGLD